MLHEEVDGTQWKVDTHRGDIHGALGKDGSDSEFHRRIRHLGDLAGEVDENKPFLGIFFIHVVRVDKLQQRVSVYQRDTSERNKTGRARSAREVLVVKHPEVKSTALHCHLSDDLDIVHGLSSHGSCSFEVKTLSSE